MISENIKKIAKDIKDIKIQGASNIEKEAINGIYKIIDDTKKNEDQIVSFVKENINHLISQRPNEPKLRNSLNYILQQTIKLRFAKKSVLLKKIKEYSKKTEKNNIKISELASNLINDGSIIMTHCHSSIVENTLKKAYDQGKKFKVINTETRPRYQGRITSKNLVDYGLDVTQIVDSAVTHYLKKTDYFLTGADVVFSDGSLLNKVGTNTISIACRYYKTPHIVLTSTHTCEVDDILNVNEKIEQRDIKEVWEDKPKKLKIENYSFDYIENQLIDKYITEEGVFSAESLYLLINSYKL